MAAAILVSHTSFLCQALGRKGIQPSIVEQISEDMRAINDELGTTILFVEQNLRAIRDLADRCYATERGTLVDQLDGDGDALAEYRRKCGPPGRDNRVF